MARKGWPKVATISEVHCTTVCFPRRGSRDGLLSLRKNRPHQYPLLIAKGEKTWQRSEKLYIEAVWNWKELSRAGWTLTYHNKQPKKQCDNEGHLYQNGDIRNSTLHQKTTKHNWSAWCQYNVTGWVSMCAYDMLSQ